MFERVDDRNIVQGISPKCFEEFKNDIEGYRDIGNEINKLAFNQFVYIEIEATQGIIILYEFMKHDYDTKYQKLLIHSGP